MDFLKTSRWICTVAVAAGFAGAVVMAGAAGASEGVTANELFRECQTRAPGEAVPVVITTHETEEAAMTRALARIAALHSVVQPPRMIRIESL